MDPVPWREAWHEALYAAGRGFYVTRGGPAAHFTTATHGPTGAALAGALLRLWLRDHEHLPAVVVDVGAGRGELATHLVHALAGAASAPAIRVVAVDVVDRPDGLDDHVEWLRSPGGADLPAELTELRDALVVAHEWLDVVPCTVAQVDATGTVRTVLVDPETGEESMGTPLDGAERAWVQDHWPASTPGERVEVGLSRDRAWSELVSRVHSGTLVAVDYGHTGGRRPSGGTLTAYAVGQQTTPVADGSCDVTAHVAMDSLDADEVVTQREALQALGVTGATPPHALAQADPPAYLAALERTGAQARLLDREGFGGFWWAVKRVQGQPVA